MASSGKPPSKRQRRTARKEDFARREAAAFDRRVAPKAPGTSGLPTAPSNTPRHGVVYRYTAEERRAWVERLLNK